MATEGRFYIKEFHTHQQGNVNIKSDSKRGIKLLTPNVNYSGRTAPLTSKVAFYIFIQQI